MKPSFCNSDKTFKAWEAEKALKGFSENTKYQKKEIKRLNGKTTVNCEQHQFVKKHGFFRRLLALLATVFSIGIACTSTTIRELLAGKKVIYVDVAKTSPAIQKADKVAQDKQVIPKRAEKKAVPAPEEKTSETQSKKQQPPSQPQPPKKKSTLKQPGPIKNQEQSQEKKPNKEEAVPTKPSDSETDKKETADATTQANQEEKKEPPPTQEPVEKEEVPTKPSDEDTNTEKEDPKTTPLSEAEPDAWDDLGRDFEKFFGTTNPEGIESAKEEESSGVALNRTFSQPNSGTPSDSSSNKDEDREESSSEPHPPPLVREDTISRLWPNIDANRRAREAEAYLKAKAKKTSQQPALNLPKHLVALANIKLTSDERKNSPTSISTCTSFIKYLRNRITEKGAGNEGLFRVPGNDKKVDEIVVMLQKQKLSEIKTRQEEFSLYDLVNSLSLFINKNKKVKEDITKCFTSIHKIKLDKNYITNFRKAYGKLKSDQKLFLANLCLLLLTTQQADPRWKKEGISGIPSALLPTLEGIIAQPLQEPSLGLFFITDMAEYKKSQQKEKEKVEFLLRNADKFFAKEQQVPDSLPVTPLHVNPKKEPSSSTTSTTTSPQTTDKKKSPKTTKKSETHHPTKTTSDEVTDTKTRTPLKLPQNLIALANSTSKPSKRGKVSSFPACTAFMKYLRNRISKEDLGEGGLFRIPGLETNIKEIVNKMNENKLVEIKNSTKYTLHDLVKSLSRLVITNKKDNKKQFGSICKIKLDKKTKKTIANYSKAVAKLESDQKLFLANFCLLLLTTQQADPQWTDITAMLTSLAPSLEGIIIKPLQLPSSIDKMQKYKESQKKELEKAKFLLENANEIFAPS